MIYAKDKSGQNDETPLEPNHTQFILIDDGTKHQYGGEFAFRARFEKAISGESFSLENTSDTSQSEGKSISSYSQSGTKHFIKNAELFFFEFR